MEGISAVIPLYNEEENVELMYRELRDVLAGMQRPYELLFVDDGSRDQTVARLLAAAGKDPHLRILQFRRNFGQTAALAAGLEHSRYDIVVTLDGDLQNDPAEIPRVVAKLEEGYDLVAGWRKNRKDKFISRRLPSMIANWIISKSTKVKLHDYGCSLKAMTGEVARGINLYGEMHRFIPALADEMGARIVEIAVNHRPRQFGKSKYGISRAIRVILDLITVKFLLGYSKRPIHFFGTLGAGLGGLGVFILALLAFERLVLHHPIGSRPMLTLGFMMALVGLQFLVFGLLGEVLARTYYESQRKRTYCIRRHFEFPAGQPGETPVRPIKGALG